MREVLRAYQNTVAGEIARFDGHVAKFMGDGVLAYFGWPAGARGRGRARRAGRPGDRRRRSARLPHPAGEPLAARVGIATGLVVVGDLVGEGAARRRRWSARRPNLAARLQEVAEPGAVVIADGTRRLLGELFELRELGPTRLKGFADPVRGFQVARRAPRRAAASRPADRAGRRPWSGATRSWRSCSSAGGRPRPARARRCSWSARPASASPGWSGPCSTRSRARSTPRCATSARPTTPARRSGRSSSSSRFAAGLEPADAEAAKLDKLEALLRQGAEDVGEAVPLIAALLGIDAGGALPGAGPHPAAAACPHAGRAGRAAPRARAPPPGADGGRGRALDRPHHPRAGRARPSTGSRARGC